MKIILSFLLAWLLNTAALYGCAALVPGVRIRSFGGALWGAAALGLINATLAPVLAFFSLPLTVVTLGLFLFVLAGLLFWLGAALVPDFEVDGCLAGVLGALVLSLINWLLGLFFNFSGWW